jgi:hypothetical protein
MADPEHLSVLAGGASVWNKWRLENPEIKPDLRGFRRRVLFPFEEDAHLGGYNFAGTDFEGADLDGYSFLSWENERTNLSGANLKKTRLSGAHLRLVDLKGVDLTGAEMGWTIIGDTSLSGVVGLAEVEHRFPTSIDIDTIEQTYKELRFAADSYFAEKYGITESRRGEFEAFLRGAGVPEHILDHYASHDASDDFYSVFVSYSHSDKHFADRLYDALRFKGIHCWKDQQNILPGDDLLTQIDRGISYWDKVLLCCSAHSLGSWWVDKELEKAIQKEERLWSERGVQVQALVPIDLDGFIFKWEGSKASLIKSRYIADFKGWEGESVFKSQFRQLEKALRINRGIWDVVPPSRL